MMMLKVVLQNITVYWMHLFLLPREVIKKMESIVGRSIWVGTLLHGKYHLVKWSLIARPIEEGGWGIIDPFAFNTVMIIKNMWRTATTLKYGHWSLKICMCMGNLSLHGFLEG